MSLDNMIKLFTGIQIATVEGGIRECGDFDYPGIFVRLDDPTVFAFVKSVLNGAGKNIS
jgi:hypothetical protein